MAARHAPLVAVALSLLAVAAIGVSAGPAAACGPQTAAVEEVETLTDPDVDGTAAAVRGSGRVSDGAEFRGWFEYRRAGVGDWASTNRTAVPVDTCGEGFFEATLTDLRPDTRYEYRAVVATANETARGPVRTFTTGAATENATASRTPRQVTETATRTETSPPCPSFRGAPGLCTTTPTPTPAPPAEVDDPPPDSPDRSGDTADGEPYLSGFAPLLAWGLAVVVVGPLVLGGLLWLDRVRQGRQG